MPDRTSALYVCGELADASGELDWRRIVLLRVEQICGCNAHATMARLGDRILYLVEGEAADVAAFLKLLSNGCDDPDSRALVGPAMARWDARPGRLMTPLLSDDEQRWLSSQVMALARNAREIQACLRWANMRTRETAFFDLGSAPCSTNESFPSAVFQNIDDGTGSASASLDFRAE